MNDAANTVEWKLGDLVIHDSDAKTRRCLMIVIGTIEATYGKEWVVRYLYTDKRDRRIPNPLCFLHDPARFGIIPPTDAEVLDALLARLKGGTIAKDWAELIKLYVKRVQAYPVAEAPRRDKVFRDVIGVMLKEMELYVEEAPIGSPRDLVNRWVGIIEAASTPEKKEDKHQ